MRVLVPKEIGSFSVVREEKEEVSFVYRERCGVLLGYRRGEDVVVKEVVELENVSSNPSLFRIDPMDLYKVWIDAERRGLDVVGVFHTHPLGLSSPSRYDVEGMKSSGMLWVIVGCDGVRAYVYKEKILEVEVELI